MAEVLRPPGIATRLEVELGERSYPIVIGSGLLGSEETMTRAVPGENLLIVTNERVGPLYIKPLERALAGRRIARLMLPDGEQHKTLATAGAVIDALVANRMNRDCVVVALGGGVVGDIAGFAAACYQRGVSYVQVPTTLLAQVDSSVGGKTGVNHPGGKNLIGAFHQPRAVVADVDTLVTLSDREYVAGLAEVVKYGLIVDRRFFDWLEENAAPLLARDAHTVSAAVHRCCAIKAQIVAADERETGARALLNLGHTFGHAIETGAGYGEWLHGEAVAAGMVLAAEMSHRAGWLERPAIYRIRSLLERFALPVEPPKIGAKSARRLLEMDKKVVRGRMRLVLLRDIGDAAVTGDYADADLDATLAAGFGAGA